MPTTRPAAVAGLFYPDRPALLRQMLDDMLAEAGPAAPPSRPKALIVPHAGYVYSGAVAARAGFVALQEEHPVIARLSRRLIR